MDITPYSRWVVALKVINPDGTPGTPEQLNGAVAELSYDDDGLLTAEIRIPAHQDHGA